MAGSTAGTGTVRALTPRARIVPFTSARLHFPAGDRVKVARVPDDLWYPTWRQRLLRVKRLVGTMLIAAAVAVGLLTLRSAIGERARAEAMVRADADRARGGATGRAPRDRTPRASARPSSRA